MLQALVRSVLADALHSLEAMVLRGLKDFHIVEPHGTEVLLTVELTKDLCEDSLISPVLHGPLRHPLRQGCTVRWSLLLPMVCSVLERWSRETKQSYLLPALWRTGPAKPHPQGSGTRPLKLVIGFQAKSIKYTAHSHVPLEP